MEVKFSTWQEAIGFLLGRTDSALEGLLTLSSKQMVDEMVIAALLHSHPDRAAAADLWRQMTAEALPSTHLESLQLGLPNSSRQVFAERVQFWEEVFRRSLQNSEPET